MPDPIVQDYLVLGLRLGRLVSGFVDCWFGDEALSTMVQAEPLANPSDLAADAARLRVRVADSALDQQRQRFLCAQLDALECSARRLAGEPMAFQDEVYRYFGVRIGLGEPERYAIVHDEINGLLPGRGDCRAKVEAFYERNAVPPEKLAECVRAVSAQLAVRTRSLFDLPGDERVTYGVVTDRPWNAFNHYHGAFNSTVTLNATAGRAIAALPLLAAHESYPGHHTEHCIKEVRLVNGKGHDEHRISLVNTPQCLMAEGTAEAGIAVAVGAGWGDWTARVLAEHGVCSDGELVERMVALVRQLLPARQDAAILLHDRGASQEDAAEYLRRWLLLPQQHATQMVTFMTDPLWRAYSVTYIEGARLVQQWLDSRPSGQPIEHPYQRLLAEPLLPSTLQDDLLGRVP